MCRFGNYLKYSNICEHIGIFINPRTAIFGQRTFARTASFANIQIFDSHNCDRFATYAILAINEPQVFENRTCLPSVIRVSKTTNIIKY